MTLLFRAYAENWDLLSISFVFLVIGFIIGVVVILKKKDKNHIYEKSSIIDGSYYVICNLLKDKNDKLNIIVLSKVKSFVPAVVLEEEMYFFIEDIQFQNSKDNDPKLDVIYVATKKDKGNTLGDFYFRLVAKKIAEGYNME